MSAVISKMLAIAKGQVGYHEGRSNGHWNNREKYAGEVPDLGWVSTTGGPWCAVFVSWVVMKAGLAELYPRTASTDVGARWFKDRKQWSEYPAVGAQVFFGTNGDMYHTGLVHNFDDTYVYTVEGNTNDSGSPEGDGVYLKKHLRTDPHVQGYGYPEGLIERTADPHPPKGTLAAATPPAPPANPQKPPKTSKGAYARRSTAAIAALVAFVTGVLGAVQHNGHDGRPIIGSHTTMQVLAWNEKSFPVMSDQAYRADFAKVLPQLGKRAVVLHSEMSAPNEIRIYRAAAARHGLRTYGIRQHGDTAISTKGLPKMKSARIQIADKPAGPASPARWITGIGQAAPQAVAFIAVHLSNGCFKKNVHRPWYSARCHALAQQIKLLKRAVAQLVHRGFAVVVGGDLNTAKTQVWGAHQVTVKVGLVQLAAIPSAHTAVQLRALPKIAGLHTDHAITRAALTLTSR